MAGLVLRTAIVALGLWLAQALVSGVAIADTGTLIVAAILLGIANAVVRPVAIVLTLPITVVTLGLFVLVVNAAMFAGVAALLEGFTVTGFFPAVFGSIVVGIVGVLASWYVGPSGRIEVMVRRGEERLPR